MIILLLSDLVGLWIASIEDALLLNRELLKIMFGMLSQILVDISDGIH